MKLISLQSNGNRLVKTYEDRIINRRKKFMNEYLVIRRPFRDSKYGHFRIMKTGRFYWETGALQRVARWLEGAAT